jgi:hypothetical protein
MSPCRVPAAANDDERLSVGKISAAADMACHRLGLTTQDGDRADRSCNASIAALQVPDMI